MPREQITVQGTGWDGNGAIVNNNISIAGKYNSNGIGNLRYVTLAGNTTFGGTTDPLLANSGRWDIRGTGATLSTGGNPYNLTKTGTNQVTLVNVAADPALADLFVNSGVFGVEGTTTLGDSAKKVAIASGATVQLYRLTTQFTKQVEFNGGTLHAASSNGAGQNDVAGAVTVNSSSYLSAAGGTMIISGPISGTGSLNKIGTGTVVISNANPSYNAVTNLNEGILTVNGALPGGITMATGTLSTTTLNGTGTVGGTTQDAV